MEHYALVDSEQLDRLRARLEVIDGLLIALKRWPEISDVVSECEDRSAARQALGAVPFMLSEVQAEHILDMPLGRRTVLGRRQLSDDRDHTLRDINELTQDHP